MKLLFAFTMSLFSLGIIRNEPIETKQENLIQVAILLDTSGSMSGLINQAKSQLWSILNTLSDARLEGEPAEIEMAIYEYGNDRLKASEGFVLQRVPFTTDVDKISQSLFAMTTNGGSEFCGEVIHQSISQLEWRDRARLKVIYIAGNEPFTQGSFDFRVACMEAKEKGVVINTIHCGDRQEGINTDWEAGAILGGGAYHHIDHNQKTEYVKSPYDDKIDQLNRRLNDTYIGYGQNGQEAKENMELQDANAGSYSQANKVQRSMYKSKKQYSNASWDLVDAYEEDEDIVNKKDQLPASMKDKSKKEVMEEIENLKRERSKIQKEIASLGEQRVEYVRTQSTKNEGSLEAAVLGSVNGLLIKNGYKNQK